MDFNVSKLKDHLHYIETAYSFDCDTVYLEIGCGPAHIGNHLLKQYNVTFIGIDFNYKLLLLLKKHFEALNYKKILLIYCDIRDIPIRSDSIDFIYGGGVIEHVSDTKNILLELQKVLKPGGVSFNTVPAFNIMWLFRAHCNIPNFYGLKQLFEFVHTNLFRNKILRRYFGYELSYTKKELYALHELSGFIKIKVGPFSFHPSEKAIRNPFLRKLMYHLLSFPFTSPVYYVHAKKK